MAVGAAATEALKYIKMANEKKTIDGFQGARKQLIRIEGQVLVVSKARWEGIMIGVFGQEIGLPVEQGKPSPLQTIWEGWDSYLTTQGSKLSKERKDQLRQAIASVLLKGDEKAYMITKYDSISDAKSKRGVLGKLVKKHFTTATEDQLSRMGGSAQKGEDRSKLVGAQLGHEEEGRGIATSVVAMAQAKQQFMNRALGNEKEKVEEAWNEIETMVGIKIVHTQIVTADGKLNKQYVPILTYQEAITNQEQVGDEKALAEITEQRLQNLADMEGSTPLRDAIAQITMYNLAGKKQKRKKTTGTKKKVINERSEADKDGKVKRKRPTRVVRDSGVGNLKSLRPKRKKTAGTNFDPLHYLAIINKQLPQTVKKNMGAPALENRTGRFAGSVKLTDVGRTKQGHVSFGYTYQQDPYRVFEVGSGKAPWAIPARDPRKLIDGSIREIAANLALGRFYTRRV